MTSTDVTPELQDAGGVGIATTLSGTATGASRVRIDDFWAGPLGARPEPPRRAAWIRARQTVGPGSPARIHGARRGRPRGGGVAARVDLAGGLTVGFVVAAAMSPVWVPHIRPFHGLTQLILVFASPHQAACG